MSVVWGVRRGEGCGWLAICVFGVMAANQPTMADPLDVAVVAVSITVEPSAAFSLSEATEPSRFGPGSTLHFILGGNHGAALSVHAPGYGARVSMQKAEAGPEVSPIRLVLPEWNQLAHGTIDLVLPANEAGHDRLAPSYWAGGFVEITVTADER